MGGALNYADQIALGLAIALPILAHFIRKWRNCPHKEEHVGGDISKGASIAPLFLLLVGMLFHKELYTDLVQNSQMVIGLALVLTLFNTISEFWRSTNGST